MSKYKKMRKAMDKALKEIAVPVLRERGFRGSYPRFHRTNQTSVDLLNFQFRDRSGGMFVVEIGKVPLEGYTFNGVHIPAEKLSTAYIPRKRLRLGKTALGQSDPWFIFDPEWERRRLTRLLMRLRPPSYERIAEVVAQSIETEGEAFWANDENISWETY
jgi:hypothetical protein